MDYLNGKVWYACGDSFTKGDFSHSTENNTFEDGPYMGQNKVYPFYIGRRTGMIVNNLAQCGQTLTVVEGRTNDFSSSLYTTIGDDADYITLYFGINDAYRAQLGNIDDKTNTTFYGAWNIVLPYLIEHHPYAKIGIIVTNAVSNRDWTDAIRQAARRHGIPILDFDGDERLPLVFQAHRPGVLPEIQQMRDKVFYVHPENHHPNAKMHEFQSTIIENWLRSL